MQEPKERAQPAVPDDLRKLDCVLLGARNNEADWELVSGRRRTRVHVSGPFSSRDFNSVSAFVYRGHGVGLLPSNYCDAALKSGQLIRVLPNWSKHHGVQAGESILLGDICCSQRL